MHVRSFGLAVAGALALSAGPHVPAQANPPPGRTPWLGVAISDGIYGVRVDEVIADTPAQDAGVVPGDEIMTVAGTRVNTSSELQTAVATHQVDQVIMLHVWRSGRVLQMAARLGPRLSAGEVLHRRLIDRPAPFFDVPAVWGTDSGRLEHLRGQVVIIEFFATECKECLDVHGRLSRLVDARAREGLVVLAVSRESRSALDTWSRQVAPSFTVLHDLYGEVFRSYRVDQLPAIVVINREGDVCYAGIGDMDIFEQARFAAGRALQSGRSFARQ